MFNTLWEFIGALGLIGLGVILPFIAKKESRPLFLLASAGSFVVGAILFVVSTIYTVDEGEALVLKSFGKVQGNVYTSGIHFKLPWFETITYPTRTVPYTASLISRSREGLNIESDFTVRYRVVEDKIDLIYSQYAKSIQELEEKVIIPVLRESLRDSISQVTAADVHSQRTAMARQINTDAISNLAKYYVEVEKVNLRQIKLPDSIEDAIQKKIQAQEEAIAAEKRAEIRIIEAKGIAESQEIINETLTGRYIQLEAIEAYKQLAQSENTTFVIMPTDPDSAGVPLILNGQD